MSNGIQKVSNELFSFQDLEKWGKFAKDSGMLPSTLTPMQGMAIIQTGRELGVPPFRALAVMGFVNGRLAMETKLILALAKQGDVKTVSVEETNDEKGNPFSCTVTMARDEETVAIPWSMEDAKRANLTTKDNWVKYPRNMLRWRSICDGLRILAPDLMLGLASKEEAEDMEFVAPLAFDPEKAVAVSENGSIITKEQRIKIAQVMTKYGWIKDGAMTAGAIEKFGALGYENSQQIPKTAFDEVLKAFAEKAPEGERSLRYE